LFFFVFFLFFPWLWFSSLFFCLLWFCFFCQTLYSPRCWTHKGSKNGMLATAAEFCLHRFFAPRIYHKYFFMHVPMWVSHTPFICVHVQTGCLI
jgi:hypothetical protein